MAGSLVNILPDGRTVFEADLENRIARLGKPIRSDQAEIIVIFTHCRQTDESKHILRYVFRQHYSSSRCPDEPGGRYNARHIALIDKYRHIADCGFNSRERASGWSPVN